MRGEMEENLSGIRREGVKIGREESLDKRSERKGEYVVDNG